MVYYTYSEAGDDNMERMKKQTKRKLQWLLALLVLLLAIGIAMLLLRTGVLYPKGVGEPVRLVENAYVGEDLNPDPMTDTAGMTLQSRLLPPDGYVRTAADTDSLLKYMRNMALEPDGTEVADYKGNPVRGSQDAVAVFAMQVGDKDLQQCADSVIRVYSEYAWSQGRYDTICFHLTNGTRMAYSDWLAGDRLLAFGSFARMLPLSGDHQGTDYDCFYAYLRTVMRYAGTKSLAAESEQISLSSLHAGEMLLEGGTPGHVVLVVDEAENEAGERCFLLAQGYMPAQSFHVLSNPAHAGDPWYYPAELAGDRIETMCYTFSGDCFFRRSEFSGN